LNHDVVHQRVDDRAAPGDTIHSVTANPATSRPESRHVAQEIRDLRRILGEEYFVSTASSGTRPFGPRHLIAVDCDRDRNHRGQNRDHSTGIGDDPYGTTSGTVPRPDGTI